MTNELNQQIAQAQAAGDWKRTRRLKSQITFGLTPDPTEPTGDPEPAPQPEPPSPPVMPGIDQGARRAPRPRTLADEITDAEAAGNWGRALHLKSKLTFDPFMRRLSSLH